MNRSYRCKGCGYTWVSEDQIFDYLQKCLKCGRTTRPNNLPSIIHYSVRGSEPRHALCSVTPFDGLDNFSLQQTTCPDCLRILSRGEGLYKKCLYCASFTQATNRPSYAFCISDIQPEDAVFDPKLGQYLSADAIDKGCKSQFQFSKRWLRFFETSLQETKKRL